MRLTLSAILLIAVFSTAQQFRVDSVTVDSVWNSDSIWNDGLGVPQQRFSRDCILSFLPVCGGTADYSFEMAIDSAKTWTSATPLIYAPAGQCSCGTKQHVRLRVTGQDRPNVAFRVKARQLAPNIYISAPKTVFEGDGLIFYATFEAGVYESDIIWHTKGLPLYRHSNPAGTRFVYADTTFISLNNIDQMFYSGNNTDQVYISFSNSGITSNSISVSLVNHSPVLDSVKMGNILLGQNANDDTMGVVRMYMNPSTKETLQVYMHDVDRNDSLSFSLQGLDSAFYKDAGKAYDSQWIFTAGANDTIWNGTLMLTDNKGGRTGYPLQIIVYSEIHSLWVASTNAAGNISLLNKMTSKGKMIFSLSRFQQVRSVNVLLVDQATGSEQTWVVDRTLHSRQSGTSGNYFTDSVFVIDNQGRVIRSVGGFQGHVTGLALNHIWSIAYAIDTGGVKKMTVSSVTPQLNFNIAGGCIEAIDMNQFNADEYWAAVYFPATARRCVYHVRNGAIIDTLSKNGRTFDSIDVVKSLAVSTRNGIYWVGCDSMLILCNMAADTVVARITGFQGAYVAADQKAAAPFAWVADAGNSKIIRINAKPSGYLSGITPYSNSAACLALGQLGVIQPRSISLDYNTDTWNPNKTLWIADYGNNRVIAIDGTTGALGDLQIDEVGSPQALSVNAGIF